MSLANRRETKIVQTYIEEVALPDAPDALMGIEEAVMLDTKLKVVGSQLVEFGSSVKGELKAAITNSVLLAQLAANKATSIEGDPMKWYQEYASTLGNIGWLQTDIQFVEQEVTDTDANLHEAILPVLTTLLGPQVAAVSVILAVLKGLKSMAEEQPWITLFDRESKRFKSHQFQFSFADLDECGAPSVSLLCFTLEANLTITQVLFFKFSDESAVLKKNVTKLSISKHILVSIQDKLAYRLAPYISSYIEDVDI